MNKIIDFINDTVTLNPEITHSYVAGQTFEGRDLTVIVLNPIKTSTRSLWIGNKYLSLYILMNINFIYNYKIISINRLRYPCCK